MVCFGTNILLTRSAVARLPVESGFFIVLATNIAVSGSLLAGQFAFRAVPPAWDWKGASYFALGGILGTFLGRRLLFDTVRLLGPSRASVFHSTSPAFALVFAWAMAGERLGWYEIALMAVVWAGLWLTQPRATDFNRHTLADIKRGMLYGLVTVAGFALGNVLRGMAMRDWSESVLGSLVSASTAMACQVLVTRSWPRITAQLRGATPAAILFYVGCGVSTLFGSILVAEAMSRMEIAIAVLIMHTTPLLIFPFSVFVLGLREELSARTLLGSLVVLAGIGLIALR